MMTAIIYHQVKPGIDCADGICAAWVAKRKYPDAELIGASYGGKVPDISGYDRVLIVDFSFDRPTLEQWESKLSELLVIDHHKTAMADLEGFSAAVFDMNESGATLAWKTLFPGESMPAFLTYVRDRDLWNFELPMSEEIHEAMSFTGRRLYQLDFLATLSAEELVELFAPIGVKLLEPKRKRIAEIVTTARFDSVRGFKILTVEISEAESRLTSDVCSSLYKANPDIPFVMAYSWNSKDEVWGLSFRSDKNGANFDVSEIAKLFGGGGHRNAAGAAVKYSDEIFDD